MSYSDWMVSARAIETQSLTIAGNLVDVTFALGGAYLIRPDAAALDLLARLVVAMGTATVADPAAFVTEARFVRLTSSGVFTVVWGAATQLRDLLGFAGNLSGSSSYTAEARSPLLWSPGKRLKPELAPLDAHGALVLDVSSTIGEGGRLTVREEGDGTTVQRYSAEHVAIDRYWQTKPDAVDGEFVAFWRSQLTTAKKLVVVREVVEGTSVTASADYSGATVLGPYVVDMSDDGMHRTPFARASGFERVESRYNVGVPVIVTPEFEA